MLRELAERTPPSSAANIFISYRRADTGHVAGRLHDVLASRFGESHIFMDISAIELGVPFRTAIEEAIGASAALLALIGPGWLNISDADGRRRLDKPDDLVRREIEIALQRPLRVVPILVDGAPMPSPDQLPPSMAGLVERQGVPIRLESFVSDAGRLVAALERLAGQVPADAGAPGPSGWTPPPAGERPRTPRPPDLDRDVAAHFRPRGSGVLPFGQRRGQYFTGRTRVLEELGAWLDGGWSQDPRARVVTGGPGAGKSAVLGRLANLAAARQTSLAVTGADEPPDGSAGAVPIDVLIHARGKAIGAVVVAIATGAGLELDNDEPETLLLSLEEEPRPLVVVVDSLDEATEPDAIARRLLGPLAATAAETGVRLLVGTRRGEERRLLARLGANTKIIDLDDRAYFVPEDVVEYAYRCLLAIGDPTITTPYQEDPDRARQVAGAIAARAGSSFLIAQLTSLAVAAQPTVVDVDVPRWRDQFPDTVAEAMDEYLARFGPNQARVRDLLIPLAFAAGAGLDDPERWARLATELGTAAYTPQDVRWLLADTPASDLLQRTQVGERLAYRLFHEALAEHLRALAAQRQPVAKIHRAFVAVLSELVPEGPAGDPDWLRSDSYTRTYLAVHAAASDDLDRLMQQPRFILAAHPGQLVAMLGTVRSEAGLQSVAVYRRALPTWGADSPVGAALLEAAQTGSAAALLQLQAHELGVDWLVARIGEERFAQPWTVRWAAGQPSQHRQVLTGHTGWVTSVAVGQVDGTPVAVTGSADRTVRVWDLRSGQPLGQPLTGHTGEVTSVAVAQVDETPVAVTGSRDQTVRVWDLRSGRPRPEPLAEQPDVGPLTGQPRAEHLADHPDRPLVVSVGVADGVPVAVTGSHDSKVVVWDLRSGRPHGRPLTNHTGWANAVAVGEVDGAPIAVTGSYDSMARVWDLGIGIGQPGAEPLKGHGGWVTGVAAVRLDEAPVAVTASYDSLVRLWDLDAGRPRGQPLTGHTSWITAVAVAELDGVPVAATGSYDRTARVWDLRAGQPYGQPLTGHTGWVTAVTIGQLDGLSIAVTGSLDETVLVWDLRSGRPHGAPLTGHASAVTAVTTGQLDGLPIAVTGSADRTVRVWDLRSRRPLGQPLTGHADWVTSVAVAQLDGTPVAVTGSHDHTLRIWDLRTGEPKGEPLTGHSGEITAVAVAELDGALVAVSGSYDHSVLVWDFSARQPRRIPLGSWVHAVTLSAEGTIVAGTSASVVALQLHDAVGSGT